MIQTITYNDNAVSISLCGYAPASIHWVAHEECRRPPKSKRFVMKRARQHAQLVNYLVRYWKALGYRDAVLVDVVKRSIDAWYEEWDPDDIMGTA